jgi:RNA polymerase sigma factor (sigma-70 family)
MNDASDREIAGWQRAFVSGDLPGFERLFRRFQREVYGRIVRIVRDPTAAEDLTVETFWRVWRSRARFDAERPFLPWALRIATNLAIEHLAHAHPTAELAAALPAPDTGDAALTDEVRRQIVEAFQSLPAKLRAAATLALIEERGYAEIADALATSVSAVKVRVFRAVRLLRARLDKKGIRP